MVYSQQRNIFVKRDVKLTEPPDAEPHVRWCERSAAKAVSYSIVSENTIKTVLPIFEKDLDLTEDERGVYKTLSKIMLKSISEIAPCVPFGKSKTTQLLKNMGKKGIITVEGKGRGTKYIIK